MQKLKIFILLFGSVALSENSSPLRNMFLKVMQEPTGKNFQFFQKACKSSGEKLVLAGDDAVLTSLKPKKRFIGLQVHVLVLALRDCLDPASLDSLQSVFSTEVLPKNLKRLITVSCKEQVAEEILAQMVNKELLPLERLRKRLKTITITPKCTNYKASFEKLILE